MEKGVLKAANISKYFRDNAQFKALDEVSLTLEEQEFVSITGRSGSGKSTLLYVLSTMDTDYEGTLYFKDQKLTGLDMNELAEIRGSHIGFVFQFHYLLPDFTILQNVMLPALKLGRLKEQEVEYKAYEKLKLLNIEDQALKPARKLSGGQQQRAAIARALINDPSIIMADEPTGNLDSVNSGSVQEIFRQLVEEQHKSILVVTHDPEFAKTTDRIVEMRDGKIMY